MTLNEIKTAIALLTLSISVSAQDNNIIVAEKDSIRIEIERLGQEINSEYDDSQIKR